MSSFEIEPNMNEILPKTRHTWLMNVNISSNVSMEIETPFFRCTIYHSEMYIHFFSHFSPFFRWWIVLASSSFGCTQASFTNHNSEHEQKFASAYACKTRRENLVEVSSSIALRSTCPFASNLFIPCWMGAIEEKLKWKFIYIYNICRAISKRAKEQKMERVE